MEKNIKIEITEKISENDLWITYGAIYKNTNNIEKRIVKKFKIKSLIEKVEKIVKEFIEAELEYPSFQKILGIKREKDNLYIILEYIDTTLELKKIAKRFKISFIIEILIEIVKSIIYLNKKGIFLIGLDINSIYFQENKKSIVSESIIKIDITNSIHFKYILDKDLITNENSLYIAPEIELDDIIDLDNIERIPTSNIVNNNIIFSIGVIGYELITGRPPFLERFHILNLSDREYKLYISSIINKIKSESNNISSLKKYILKALEKDPTKRYMYVSEFLKDLEKIRKSYYNEKYSFIKFLLIGSLIFCCLGFLLVFINNKISNNNINSSLSYKESFKYIEKKEKKEKISKNKNIFYIKYEKFLKKIKKKIDKNTMLTNFFKNMCLVKGGETIIGDEEGEEDEKPVRKVKVRSFYMDKTEVTNEEYQLFIIHTGYKPPLNWENGKYPPGKNKYPVVNINWYDAKLYALWCNKRLPTEIEWEMAAHGSNQERIFKWPWGNYFIKGYANVGTGELKPVGYYPAGESQFGILDLAGNVWEWTESWFNPDVKRNKVIKGGSYKSSPYKSRTTYRDGFFPESFREDIGFRCVRDIK